MASIEPLASENGGSNLAGRRVAVQATVVDLGALGKLSQLASEPLPAVPGIAIDSGADRARTQPTYLVALIPQGAVTSIEQPIAVAPVSQTIQQFSTSPAPGGDLGAAPVGGGGNVPVLASLAPALTGPVAVGALPEIERAAPKMDLSRYSVIFSAPDGVSDARLSTYMSALRETGFPVGEPNRVGFTVSKTNVRYFHAEDEAAARKLAGAVDGIARDFTDFSPQPPSGMIEIWLKGKPVRRPAASSGGGVDPGLAALRNRLLQQLRQGEFLKQSGN